MVKGRGGWIEHLEKSDSRSKRELWVNSGHSVDVG